jgi:hypothetical protein
MMRIDLPTPLKPGQKFAFNIDWSYNINEQKVLGGRSGYEHFEEDKNDLFEIAQWFPRMAAYYDVMAGSTSSSSAPASSRWNSATTMCS